MQHLRSGSYDLVHCGCANLKPAQLTDVNILVATRCETFGEPEYEVGSMFLTFLHFVTERTLMAQFHWTDDLSTGSTLIDDDHQQLIACMNTLFDAMERSGPNDAICEPMNNLVQYTREHFGREEAEMDHVGYVASLAHKSEHENLLRQIVALKEMLESGAKINVSAVEDFLSQWLREHIVKADSKLAAALKRGSQTA